MISNHIIFILFLGIGIVTAYESFTFGDREPEDRPLYIITLQSNETADIVDHFVHHEWFGVQEVFSQVYVEASSWNWATLSLLGNEPIARASFELEVAAYHATRLSVNIIVFGLGNQTSLLSADRGKPLLKKVEKLTPGK